MIRSVDPYLNFAGNTEEAFNVYRSIFGGEFQGLMRYRDVENTMGLGEDEMDLVAHVALPLGPDRMLMGTDVAGAWAANFTVGTNTYIHLEVETADDADRIFAGLSAGGTVEMPLEKTFWAEKYGSCRDRFGVQWMVSYTGSVTFPG